MEAARICSAVMHHLTGEGYGCLPEFALRTARRPDVSCISEKGHIIMIEIKSSLADFTADKKWHEYREWADEFYFAVGDDFPLDRLPDEEMCGIFITDGFDVVCHRKAPIHKLAPARRHHLTRRLARAAMMRHYRSQLPDEAQIISGRDEDQW